MTFVEALQRSRERYEAGERERAGWGYTETMEAPAYCHPRFGHMRWDPAHVYFYSGEALLSDGWVPNTQLAQQIVQGV